MTDATSSSAAPQRNRDKDSLDRIVVFDPDNTARPALVHLLEGEGYEVEAADSTEQVLEILKRKLPSLLVLDPAAVGGIRSARALLAAFPEVGTVISGNDASDAAATAVALDAFASLAKPYSKNEVAVAMASALRLHHREMRARAAEQSNGVFTTPSGRGPLLMQPTKEEEFLVNCSHELRTPLTPIMGWAGIFRRKASYTEDEVRFFAQTVLEHGKKLEGTVASLLHSASIHRDGAHVKLSALDVPTLLHDASKPIELSGRVANVVVWEGAETVEADPDYITEVLEKIVDNAVKFSPERSPIDLTAVVRRNQVVFMVSDRGPGIPEELHESVFNCFVQADSSSTRMHAGLGLGLFISRELVRAHGGHVWIEDRPDGGTRVCFSIPGEPANDARGEESSTPVWSEAKSVLPKSKGGKKEPTDGTDDGPLRILVVDDEEDMRHMILLALRKHGYQADEAGSVDEARSRLEANPYAIMLCDVRMRGELALNLVRDAATTYPDTEIVMITAIDDPKFARAAIELGAFAYMVKPFKPNDLLINVAAAFHHRSETLAERSRRRFLEEQVEERTRALAKTARHYQEVVSRSLTDELTGLRNYRYFKMELESELHRAARYEQPLSLLIFDIDLFKGINDRYGHSRGDAVLAELAARVSPQIRPHTDTLARYGGEEFAVILPQTDREGALAVAERIRKVVSETPFEAEVDEGVWVTISLGVTTYPDDAVTADTLFRSADWAMFRAKAKGRDCVSSADESEDEELYVEFDKSEEALERPPATLRIATSDESRVGSDGQDT
jgi:diguanylate cyclase (GGDEF)-like protein